MLTQIAAGTTRTTTAIIPAAMDVKMTCGFGNRGGHHRIFIGCLYTMIGCQSTSQHMDSQTLKQNILQPNLLQCCFFICLI